MSAIEEAILGAVGAKPQKTGEPRQKYLTRLMLGVQKLPDDKWEDLASTPGAQDWCNSAIEADNAKAEIPDFPDAEDAEESSDEADEDEGLIEEEEDDDAEVGEEEDEGEDEPGAEEEEEVTTKAKPAAAGKKGAKAKAPAKAPAKAAAKAAPAAKRANGAGQPASRKAAPEAKKAASGGKKPTSMRRTLKMIVIKKPKMPVDELIEALEKKGFSAPSKITVVSIRADTRDTIKVLNEAGITQIDL